MGMKFSLRHPRILNEITWTKAGMMQQSVWSLARNRIGSQTRDRQRRMRINRHCIIAESAMSHKNQGQARDPLRARTKARRVSGPPEGRRGEERPCAPRVLQ